MWTKSASGKIITIPCAFGLALGKREVVYILNGLSNVAPTTVEPLNESIRTQGVCEAAALALRRWSKDPRLQAAGIRAVRAVALRGEGGSVDALTRLGAPTAVARAQRFFLRNREIQFACLGAVEALFQGGGRTSRGAFASADSVVPAGSSLSISSSTILSSL